LSLKSFFALPFYFFLSLLGSSQAADPHIYIKTSPLFGLIRPFADPINMSLLVTGSDDKPVERGTVEIVLDGPQPGWLFSTDLPLVEGTRLLALQMPLRQGRANWKYLFPIRGNYRLSVDVTLAGGKKVGRTFEIRVRENERKWALLAAFCTGLFLLGFIAGRTFTSNRAAVATALLAVALAIAGRVIAHDGEPAVQTQQKAQTAITVEPAVVGKPSRVRWQLLPVDQAGGDEPVALLTLAITHLEKAKVVFAIEKVVVAREYVFDFHFPDGAEYRVDAVAERAGQPPVRDEQLVSVTGIEPPLAAQFPALVLFLTVLVGGLGAGRFSKRAGNRK
jgi:hypothetical protein